MTTLLLIKDVEDLGRSGDVVRVKPGFARNYLLPRGVAITADKNALRMQERLQEERKLKAAQDRKESEELARQLKEVTLKTVVKVDHDGHMYGSVSALDIVHLFQEQKGLECDKRSILLKQPIKTLGTHTVELKLKEDVVASFTLEVEPEGGFTKHPSKEPEASSAE